jgi:hypothetical protein
MADVQSIIPAVWTSKDTDSGTDGAVFLGIGGREFRLDSKYNTLNPGDAFAGTVGLDSQVKNPSLNDPRTPYVLRSQDLGYFPTYLRLEGDDHWKIAFALVLVRSGPDAANLQFTNWFSSHVGSVNGHGGLWLGPRAGKCLFLRQSSKTIVIKQLKAAKLLDAAKPFLSPPRAPRRRK